MRKDMKRVIIDTGRREDLGWPGIALNVRSRERVALQRDPDLLPEREGTGKRLGGGTRWPGDRLTPLHRWLDKQVGRPWDDVWSEICASNDARSIDGWHLRLHARESVRLPSDGIHSPWYAPPLRVDEHGILRRNPTARARRLRLRRKPARPVTPTEPLVVVESERLRYERLDRLWYVLQWDGRAELHVWDARRGQRVLMRLAADDPRRWRKRRLSNDVVRALRLERRARRPDPPRRSYANC